jgi:penicillin-binding protein 1A
MDAWFAGYHPTLTAITWIGYDTPRKLGDRETGGGLSLPVWISYMQHALQGVPVMEPTAPAGLTHEGGDWAYIEFSRGAGVSRVGVEDNPSNSDLPTSDEKKNILELFKN